MMMDMGHSMKETEAQEVPSEGRSDKPMYPSMHLDHKIPDELKEKDVGDMCRLEIVGKIRSKSIDERNGEATCRIEIEIHKMGYIGKAGKITKDEYLSKNEDEREEYDKENAEENEKEMHKEEEE